MIEIGRTRRAGPGLFDTKFVITCDTGGTSTDVSLVQALTPTMVRPSGIVTVWKSQDSVVLARAKLDND